MGVAYIMRGVPGSGKTPRAQELAGKNGSVHSTSDYFMISGEYVFDARKLQSYHQDNYDAFVESLAFGVPVVICDNTNIKSWEYCRYVSVARDYGYEIIFVVMPHPDPDAASQYGAHKVPAWKIRKMIENWEEI